MSIRGDIALILNSYPLGKLFTLDDLYDDGLRRSNSAGRRLRELREVGWVITYTGVYYRLDKKGCLEGSKSWGSGRKTISQKLRRKVFERDNRKCTVCGKSAEKIELTIGHIIPISNQGTDDYNNLTTECIQCNEPWKNEQYKPEQKFHELTTKHSQFSEQIEKMSNKEIKEMIELMNLKLSLE